MKEPSNPGEVIVAVQVIDGRLEPGRARNIILLLAASVALMMTGFGIILPIFARRLTDFGQGVEALGLMTMAFSLTLGQATLGRMSDRYGRKPLIVTGVALNATLYFGLVYLTDFYAVLGVAAIAGLGGALLGPAISAFFLDITAEQHRSRVIGIKESSYALGGVAGPLLVVIASRFTDAHGVFLLAGGLTVVAMILALALLREPRYLRQ